METVNSDRGQVRFGIKRGSDSKKIFYYFIQNDKSIGMGNYYPGNGTAVANFGKDEQWEVSVSKLKASGKKFSTQKTSFHKSGVVTNKDRQGNRFSDATDPVSISFSDIVDPIQVRVMYTADINLYPDCGEKTIINICDIQSITNLMIKVFLAPVNFDFKKWINEIDSSSVIYIDTESLGDLSLNIYTVFRESNNRSTPDGHIDCDALF